MDDKTVTFTLTPAAPGTPTTMESKEATVRLALNHGLVKAIQEASWVAYVYGRATVTAVWTDDAGIANTKSWTVQVSPTVGEG